MTRLEPGFYELVATKMGVDKRSASVFLISDIPHRDQRRELFYWVRQWRRRGWYPKVQRIPDDDFRRQVLLRHLDDRAYRKACKAARRKPQPQRMSEVLNDLV